MRAKRGGSTTATATDVVLILLVAAGLVGVIFYAYSSYRIGEKFGKWSTPYFAVYLVLLLAALSPVAQAEPIASPLAVLMSVVSWLLYTHIVLRKRIVSALLPIRVAAVLLGLLALVVFPMMPQAAAGFAVLYRVGAVLGWLGGVRASGKTAADQPAPAPPDGP